MGTFHFLALFEGRKQQAVGQDCLTIGHCSKTRPLLIMSSSPDRFHQWSRPLLPLILYETYPQSLASQIPLYLQCHLRPPYSDCNGADQLWLPFLVNHAHRVVQSAVLILYCSANSCISILYSLQ